MATGAYPSSVTKRPVRVEGSWCGGGYSTRIAGYHAIIHMSDGSEVSCCTQPYGHKKSTALVRCATAAVDKLNEAAGIPVCAR